MEHNLGGDSFKSYVPGIESPNDIFYHMCYPLEYQYLFEKRTSPWEMQEIDHRYLENFRIESHQIDRLYLLEEGERDYVKPWDLMCRLNVDGVKYFVSMGASCDYTGFDCRGGGFIQFTKLPDFFLENIADYPDMIYTYLKNDGYSVQKPNLEHRVSRKFWKNPPMLKFLCHEGIYKHSNVLSHFKEVLPKMLVNSVMEFIQIQISKDE